MHELERNGPAGWAANWQANQLRRVLISNVSFDDQRSFAWWLRAELAEYGSAAQ